MATINYYLDKVNKSGLSPIHLRINCNGSQIKISTKEKVDPDRFDKIKQRATGYGDDTKSLNYFLSYLKDKANDLLNGSHKKKFTNVEVKARLNSVISSYCADNQVSIVKENEVKYGKSHTFIDFFAGAGGFSEGFLQASFNNQYFDFRLGSDINENCELTHIVRYNHQLGLDAEFICQDITEHDFLSNLEAKLGGQTIDVICGGPPCQSFSLAGKRRKFDKKDDLFANYLQIIKKYKPKYFVMENVKGILTKDKGKIKERIIKEIRSIIDVEQIGKLEAFVWQVMRENIDQKVFFEFLIKRLDFEKQSESELKHSQENYIKSLETRFKKLIPKFTDYKTSKTDENINTIRHGFNLLLRRKEIAKLQYQIMKERDLSYIDNDSFVDSFTGFIYELEYSSIINKISNAFDDLAVPKQFSDEVKIILLTLNIYVSNFESCMDYLYEKCSESESHQLDVIMEDIRLYKINKPFVANASNYGVPQNRERVLFIGCRKDQVLIEDIPATVTKEEKVTIFEALHDLDFVGNDEEASFYEKVAVKDKLLKKLLKKRSIDGKNGQEGVLKYSEWSKKGRLHERFDVSPPFYVKNTEALNRGEKSYDELHNHKTSKQNKEVVDRLRQIIKAGGYQEAKSSLEELGISSQKRNYNLLDPEKQSSTIMTIPDDYVHYNSPRALTVREMARLQSFDDSFVFQGKRSTGGVKRKTEVPQYTLVGNAVPPLLARAVATEILKNIK